MARIKTTEREDLPAKPAPVPPQAENRPTVDQNPALTHGPKPTTGDDVAAVAGALSNHARNYRLKVLANQNFDVRQLLAERDALAAKLETLTNS